MERRGQQEMGSNPMGYTPPQESPVKLPLAPILSTPPDHRRPNAIFSARRGSSIFSPTQTLDHPHSPPPHHHHQLSPPPPPAPPQSSGASPDPDPSTLTASNPNDPAPPSLLPPPEALAAANAIRYKECLKNHAASMGGHVVDGCGEFMPGGDDGTPEALRCAACDCHRNFHRKESCGEHPSPPHHHHHNHPVANNISSSSHRQNHTSAPPHLRNQFTSPAAMVSFGGDSSSEDLDAFQPGGHAAAGPSLMSGSKKRFRTKFSKDQKERMKEFAGKLGWRIQKQNEAEVQQFCGEVGVKRQVFKVWMHNNKQATRKRERSV